MDEIAHKKIVKDQFYQNLASWKKSFIEGFCYDEYHCEVPWYSYKAIEFIKRFVKKNHRIFEFGCGSSTLFYANNASQVVSLESNKIWSKIIKEKLYQHNFKNSDFSEKKFNFIDHQNSQNFEKNDCKLTINLMTDALTNNNYENFCENYSQKFDIIVVDSLKRHLCVVNSYKSLSENGILILDDSQRKNYQKTINFLVEKNFKKLDFIGIAPGQLTIKNTSIFIKN